MLGTIEYVPSSRMGLPISSRTTILDPYGDLPCRSRFSLQKRDILLLAHVLEDGGPHAHTDLAQVRLLEQQHLRAGLPNAPTNAERQLVVEHSLMIGQVESVELVGHSKLLFECCGIDTDAP